MSETKHCITCGIYCIRNLINNKKYIGKSTQIEKRWKQHISSLRNNHHINIKLQQDWNEYGQANFEFKILKECEFKYLDRYEDYYTKKYNAIVEGYSIRDTFDYSDLSIEEEQELQKQLIHILKGLKNGRYYISCFSKILKIKDYITSILFKDLQWENIEKIYNLKIFIDTDTELGNKIIEKTTYNEWQNVIDKAMENFYLG